MTIKVWELVWWLGEWHAWRVEFASLQRPNNVSLSVNNDILSLSLSILWLPCANIVECENFKYTYTEHNLHHHHHHHDVSLHHHHPLFIPLLCTCIPYLLCQVLTVLGMPLQQRHGIANMWNLAGFLGFLWKGFSGIACFNSLAGCLPDSHDESLPLFYDTFSTLSFLWCFPPLIEMYSIFDMLKDFQNDFIRN